MNTIGFCNLSGKEDRYFESKRKQFGRERVEAYGRTIRDSVSIETSLRRICSLD